MKVHPLVALVLFVLFLGCLGASFDKSLLGTTVEQVFSVVGMSMLLTSLCNYLESKVKDWVLRRSGPGNDDNPDSSTQTGDTITRTIDHGGV